MVRRREIVLAAVTCIVLLAGCALAYLHDTSVPYDPAQALNAFRASPGPQPADSTAGALPVRGATPAPTTAPSAAATVLGGHGSPQPAGRAASSAPAPPASASRAPGAPSTAEPGVYSYATDGYEQLDALGSTRHDYPTRSAITYRAVGCGQQQEWQPLQGRISRDTLCRSPQGLEPRQSVQRREFYGQSETQDLRCDPGFRLVPREPRAGATTTGACRSSDTALQLSARVVDVTTLVVGGHRTQAIHQRVTGRLTGKTRGGTTRDEWFSPRGLLLRAVASTTSDQDTSGTTVHYSERYDLRLESLTPQR